MTENKGDLISREALKNIAYINKGNFNTVEGIREWIDNAPTVEAYTEEQVKELVELNKKLSEERPQGKWFDCIEVGTLKARHGDYVLYKVDFLLDNLTREVYIMEGARRMSERPQGKWIYTPNIIGLSEYEGITCSICGDDSIGDFNFCPHCGADMRGKEK